MIALSQFPGIDPVKDSTAALQAAFNMNQPITWDCRVPCLMGTDYTKTVFVPDKSDVTFTPRGELVIDNAGFPGICFFHAISIWRDTKVHYVGSLSTTESKAAGTWTDTTARTYLLKNSLAHFLTSAGCYWTGPSNGCAIFSVRGESAVTFNGLKAYVDADVPASSFMPVLFATDLSYPKDAICPTTTYTAPSLTVTDADIDGVYMGFVGGGTIALRNITRHRYSDLQDADGSNTGGAAGNIWFAPPHLVYLQGSIANPLTGYIKNVVDLGPYVGNPLRRKSGSGMILSLKVELANGFTVDGYYSRCLDGGIDVLSNGSTVGGKIRNATFLVDTSIHTIDGKCMVMGCRFPSSHPYPASEIDISVANVQLAPCNVYWPPPGILMRAAVQHGY